MDTHDPARRRVLILTKGLGAGGAEQLIVEQVLARGPGVEYSVAFVRRDLDHLEARLRAAGVVVRNVAGWFPGAWLLVVLVHLWRERIDVLHVHNPSLAVPLRLVRPLLRRLGVALVYTEHNEPRAYRPVVSLGNRITYDRQDAAIAVSEQVRRTMPATGARVHVVLHGIDTARVAATEAADLRGELGLPSDAQLVGTVANLRPEKAYPVLFDAADRIIAARHHVHVVAVGHGPLAASLRAHLIDSGRDRHITMLGHRADAIAVLRALDVFVLASDHEGLPVVLMEALTLGLPIVATAVGGVPELIEDGCNGRLVPPRRPDLLATAVLELLVDGPERARLGAAARTAARSLDVRRSTDQLEDIYRAVSPMRTSR
jgi:glycosyltransferase involved in cell wall biosynthesis